MGGVIACVALFVKNGQQVQSVEVAAKLLSYGGHNNPPPLHKKKEKKRRRDINVGHLVSLSRGRKDSATCSCRKRLFLCVAVSPPGEHRYNSVPGSAPITKGWGVTQ